MRIRVIPSLLSVSVLSLVTEKDVAADTPAEGVTSAIIANKRYENQITWVGVDLGEKVQVRLKSGRLLQNLWKLVPTGDAYSSYQISASKEDTDVPMYMKATHEGKVETNLLKEVIGTKFFLFDAGEEYNGFTGYHIITEYGLYLRSQETSNENGLNLLTTASPGDSAVWYFLTRRQPEFATLDISTEDFFYSFQRRAIDHGGIHVTLPVIAEGLPPSPVYPAVFAQCMSYNEVDPVATRMKKNPGFPFTQTYTFLEEERSEDLEVSHQLEDFGFLAIREGHYFDEHDGRFVGVVGTVDEAIETWQTAPIRTDEEIENPVVIMNSFTYNDDSPGHIRVTDVESERHGIGSYRSSFMYKFEEFVGEYHDSIHAPESASFMIFSVGTYSIGSGKLFVGTVGATVGGHWGGGEVKFGFDLPCDPVILAQPQTFGVHAPLVTRLKLRDNEQHMRSGFKAILQKTEGAEYDENLIYDETVGVVAFCRDT